jgi:hypothetical protein
MTQKMYPAGNAGAMPWVPRHLLLAVHSGFSRTPLADLRTAGISCLAVNNNLRRTAQPSRQKTDCREQDEHKHEESCLFA